MTSTAKTDKKPIEPRRRAITSRVHTYPKPALTHEQRQALIHAPFACERPGGCLERQTIIPGKSWGGPKSDRIMGVDELSRFDESYLRYSAGDDPRQGEL